MAKGQKQQGHRRFVDRLFVPKALGVIRDAKLDDQPTDKNVRDLVKQADGANSEFKSTFKDQPSKISCVKVPRHNFSNEILVQIDTRKLSTYR